MGTTEDGRLVDLTLKIGVAPLQNPRFDILINGSVKDKLYGGEKISLTRFDVNTELVRGVFL